MGILQTNWLNTPMMMEQKSFDLLLYDEKQPIFKNIKHAIRNSGKEIVVIPIHGIHIVIAIE